PVRHSFSFGGASSGERKSVRLACIRHAASVRPEPGSNSHKKVFETILRLLSSIVLIDLLAYCLLCCLFLLNRNALHIWFVLFVQFSKVYIVCRVVSATFKS